MKQQEAPRAPKDGGGEGPKLMSEQDRKWCVSLFYQGMEGVERRARAEFRSQRRRGRGEREREKEEEQIANRDR
jgi:hypothetical protein